MKSSCHLMTSDRPSQLVGMGSVSQRPPAIASRGWIEFVRGSNAATATGMGDAFGTNSPVGPTFTQSGYSMC